jgi:hypothetical protein
LRGWYHYPRLLEGRDNGMTSTDSLVAFDLLRLAQGRLHQQRGRTCPICHEDLMRTGLPSLAYTFESCDCSAESYPHLIEQLWHRECLRGSGVTA